MKNAPVCNQSSSSIRFIPLSNAEDHVPVTAEDGLLVSRWVENATRIYMDRLREEKASWQRWLAWKGACWCSDEPLGGFPYGPGPGDSFVPVSLLRRFFHAMEMMNPDEDEQCVRFAYVLALFEAIALVGLDECAANPLFTRSVNRVDDLLALAPSHVVHTLLKQEASISECNMIHLHPNAESRKPRLNTRSMADSLFSLLDDERPTIMQTGA